MIVTKTALPGVLMIEPRVFRDDRGFFLESFSAERFATHGLPIQFRQDNQSHSRSGVLRGLHYQLRHPQGKLVTVIRGTAFDVAVDIRRGSPTFGKWHGVSLSGDQPRFVWIPPGFAHGFCVTSDAADFVYKCTDVYVPGDERSIAWNDPTLDIDWPVRDPLLSEKDRLAPTLAAAHNDLPVFPDTVPAHND